MGTTSSSNGRSRWSIHHTAWPDEYFQPADNPNYGTNFWSIHLSNRSEILQSYTATKNGNWWNFGCFGFYYGWIVTGNFIIVLLF